MSRAQVVALARGSMNVEGSEKGALGSTVTAPSRICRLTMSLSSQNLTYLVLDIQRP